jgi:hypothetical protein
VEGREWHVVHNDGTKMTIPHVPPPKNIEDEVAVKDGTAEVSHVLHLATVVAH